MIDIVIWDVVNDIHYYKHNEPKLHFLYSVINKYSSSLHFLARIMPVRQVRPIARVLFGCDPNSKCQ